MERGIELNGESLSLRMKLDAARRQLTALLEEFQRLTTLEGPWLQALYDHRLGRLECELLQVKVEVRTLRRRVEEITAFTNRGQTVGPVQLELIEARLSRELESWWRRVEERQRAVRKARNLVNDGEPADPTVAKAARSLYRRLALALHPDAHPDMTELFERFWPEVLHAYRQLDVDRLMAIQELVAARTAPEVFTRSEELVQEIERVTRMVATHLERLATLRKQPPFIYEERLLDEGWCEAKERELNAAIAAESGTLSTLEKVFAALLGRPREDLH